MELAFRLNKQTAVHLATARPYVCSYLYLCAYYRNGDAFTH